MERVIFNVKGMSCGHCVRTIEGNVGKLEGVKAVNVDLLKAQVEVQYSSVEVSLETIKETIDDQGYEVE